MPHAKSQSVSLVDRFQVGSYVRSAEICLIGPVPRLSEWIPHLGLLLK